MPFPSGNNKLLVQIILIAGGCVTLGMLLLPANRKSPQRAQPDSPKGAAHAAAITAPSDASGHTDALPRVQRLRDSRDAAVLHPPPPLRSRRAKTRAIDAAPAPPEALPAAKSKPPKAPPTVERQALAYVGVDPLAEAIWIDAINDPKTSSHDRHNLIEDLNEDGFPNPRRPTPEDLPMILNRLSLIENLAPDAMDEVNAAAFAEAYKDLVNMYARVLQQ